YIHGVVNHSLNMCTLNRKKNWPYLLRKCKNIRKPEVAFDNTALRRQVRRL
ncbi:hypothetical protein EWB00_008159, partial [Schistosoma japonicum]